VRDVPVAEAEPKNAKEIPENPMGKLS
jgi:hypothetical protein